MTSILRIESPTLGLIAAFDWERWAESEKSRQGPFVLEIVVAHTPAPQVEQMTANPGELR